MKRVAVMLSALVVSQAVNAETATYGYDALGRLINSSYVGGPRDGKQASLKYDPAGNRTQYSFGTGTPTPPPTSMSALNPSDVLQGSISFTFAPTKFEQNGVNPLIQSFSVPSGGGTAVVNAGGSSVSYTTPAANRGTDVCNVGDDRIIPISVSVRDSAGTTVTSSYTITVSGVAGTARPCV
jgi:hypothetical protein